jgi:hypothetical protein
MRCPELLATLQDIATLADTPAGAAILDADPALALRTVIAAAKAVVAKATPTTGFSAEATQALK